jgi:hypothetical protein
MPHRIRARTVDGITPDRIFVEKIGKRAIARMDPAADDLVGLAVLAWAEHPHFFPRLQLLEQLRHVGIGREQPRSYRPRGPD